MNYALNTIGRNRWRAPRMIGLGIVCLLGCLSTMTLADGGSKRTPVRSDPQRPAWSPRGTLPSMPGFIVESYSELVSPTDFDFGTGAAVYVGDSTQGSMVRRLLLGGSVVQDFGLFDMVSSTGVAYDASGSISTLSQALFVGGQFRQGGAGVFRIAPDQTTMTFFGPEEGVGDIVDMAFDNFDHMLMVDPVTSQVYSTDGTSLQVLIFSSSPPRRLAVDHGTGDLLVSSDDGVVRAYASDGTLSDNAVVTGLGAAAPLAVGPATGPWYGELLLISPMSGALQQVDAAGGMVTLGTGFDAGGHINFGLDGALYVGEPSPGRLLRITPDCNNNGVADFIDVDNGTSDDCQANGIPDDCEPDCNNNGLADECDIQNGNTCCNPNQGPGCSDPDIEACVCAQDMFCCIDNWDTTCADEVATYGCGVCGQQVNDCNQNGIPDDCDIADNTSNDCNADGQPDECEIREGSATDPPGTYFCTLLDCASDCNANGIPDDCEPDCDDNNRIDFCEIRDCPIEDPTCADCNNNDRPDECDIADLIESDCNGNLIPDSCDLANGAPDCNANGIPDDCDIPPLLLDADFSQGFPPGWIVEGLWRTTDECHGADTCDGATQWAYYGLLQQCNVQTGSANDGRLRSPSIMVDPGISTLTLQYCSAYDGEGGIEGLNRDLAFVVVEGDVVDIPSEDGTQLTWETRTVDLTAYVGHTIRLMFIFDTVDETQNTGLGWQIANVKLISVGAGDCNLNGFPDDCDIDDGVSLDCNNDGFPDECQLIGNDCNSNGTPDECDPDFDLDMIPDDCDNDLDGDGVTNDVDVCDDSVPGLDVNIDGGPLGDFDDDCDIDNDDYFAFSACLDVSGPGFVPPFFECRDRADFDGDLDVDLLDWHLLLAERTGPFCLVESPFTDCNNNGHPDACDIAEFFSLDCNENGVPDDCDISSTGGAGVSDDCNLDGIPDDCQMAGHDCNLNQILDACENDCNCNRIDDAEEVAAGDAFDCDNDGLLDSCTLAAGLQPDCQMDGVPDNCQLAGNDCNNNNLPDDCEADCNCNSIPDEFEADCNGNQQPDDCDIDSALSEDCNGNGMPDECEQDCNCNQVPDPLDLLFQISADCNNNNLPDECDIAAATSVDCQFDGIPDECQVSGNDCNANNVPDDCDIADLTSNDCQSDGTPDECQLAANDCNQDDVPDDCQLTDNDCNTNSVPDDCDIADLTSSDCQSDGTPDECQLDGNDCNADGVPDDCQTEGNDCNSDATPDECQLDGNDCNADGVPDDCQTEANDCNSDAIPDDCQLDGNDCNADMIPDDCELAANDCNADMIPDDCQLVDNDCNANSTPDDCDIAAGGSLDDNENGIPDECEK